MIRANGVTAFLRLLPAGQLHQPLGAEGVPGGHEGWGGLGLPRGLCLRGYGWRGGYPSEVDRRSTGGGGKSGAARTEDAPGPAKGNAAE